MQRCQYRPYGLVRKEENLFQYRQFYFELFLILAYIGLIRSRYILYMALLYLNIERFNKIFN